MYVARLAWENATRSVVHERLFGHGQKVIHEYRALGDATAWVEWRQDAAWLRHIQTSAPRTGQAGLLLDLLKGICARHAVPIHGKVVPPLVMGQGERRLPELVDWYLDHGFSVINGQPPQLCFPPLEAWSAGRFRRAV